MPSIDVLRLKLTSSPWGRRKWKKMAAAHTLRAPSCLYGIHVSLLSLSVVLCGCANPPRYVPPADGPYATLTIPGKTSTFRFGLSQRTFRFAIGDESGCGRYFKPDDATGEPAGSTHLIPAGRPIFVTFEAVESKVSCTVTSGFDTKVGGAYILEGQLLAQGCFPRLSDQAGGTTDQVALKPAFNDALFGQKVCASREAL